MSAKKTANPKLPVGLCQANPITSFITNIWNKKITPQVESLSQMSVVEKRQSQSSEDESTKIIMSRRELMEFTKKFALNQIDHEEEIERLKVDLSDKQKRVHVLSEQIDELRTQEDYLIKVMEQLRDRHVNQIVAMNNKYENCLKQKQAEIQYLNEELIKIRKWLEEEKVEAKRCIEFLKIKDEIIEKLEWDILKCKNELRQTKDAQSCKGIKSYLSSTLKLSENNQALFKVRTNSTKKIIIRKQKRQQGSNTKQNKENIFSESEHVKKCIEFQSGHRQSDQIIDQEQDCKIKRSIDDLNEISKRIKESQADKENLLVTKCMFLEKHVEKLTRELSRVKHSNVLSYSKDTFEGFSGLQFTPMIISEL